MAIIVAKERVLNFRIFLISDADLIGFTCSNSKKRRRGRKTFPLLVTAAISTLFILIILILAKF